MTRTRMLLKSLALGALVSVSAISIAACCNGDKEGDTPTTDPAAAATDNAPTEAPTPLETTDPKWKQKCPDAERPESGTVTALKSLSVFKGPNPDTDKLTTVGPGTWVNLLGAKGTWWCIDYPCGVGQLCPGWIEERYAQKKPPEVKDAGPDAVPDAADGGRRLIRLPDGGIRPLTPGGGADAAAPPPATTTPPASTATGKAPPGIRPGGPPPKLD